MPQTNPKVVYMVYQCYYWNRLDVEIVNFFPFFLLLGFSFLFCFYLFPIYVKYNATAKHGACVTFSFYSHSDLEEVYFQSWRLAISIFQIYSTLSRAFILYLYFNSKLILNLKNCRIKNYNRQYTSIWEHWSKRQLLFKIYVFHHFGEHPFKIINKKNNRFNTY